MANAALTFFSASLIEFTPKLFLPKPSILLSKPNSLSSSTLLPPPIPRSLATTHLPSSRTLNRVSCQSASTLPSTTTHYEFLDGPTEVELRLDLGANEVQSYKDIIVDSDDKSLAIRVQHSGSLKTLMETACLYGRIKPAETIWYMDDGQVIVSLKKQDPDLKWPDIVETWESLTVGVMQLLKGTSIYLVGESTEINDIVARELAVGLGYAPLNTKELLETYTKQTLDSWVTKEGPESVATAESAILESLSCHVRAVVATIGGQHGSAAKTDGWRHLYTGFTVWLSQSEATDEDSAKAEARRNVEDGIQGYTNAEVVVKLGGWDPNYAKSVAQASLSALKQLILSDKKLPGKKSLYIRLGCRGDWPNIEPPGGDPSSSTGSDTSSSSSSRSS